jgi:hypothetical protein
VASGATVEAVKRTAALFTLATLAANVGRALAQSPDSTTNPRDVQPERPTVATHAGTVAPRYFEIETGLEFDRLAGSSSALAPTVLKLGVAPRVQFSVFGSGSQAAGTGTGFGDAGIDVKWRLLEGAPLLGDFAVQPMIKFPTGSFSSGRGTGTTDFTLLLISSYDLGPVAMDLNAGYTRRTGNGSNAPLNATLWTASFGGPAIGPVGWVAELYGYPATSGPAGDPSIVALLAGPTFLARNSLSFDTGIIIPIRGPQPHAIYVGSVINVGRVW